MGVSASYRARRGDGEDDDHGDHDDDSRDAEELEEQPDVVRETPELPSSSASDHDHDGNDGDHDDSGGQRQQQERSQKEARRRSARELFQQQLDSFRYDGQHSIGGVVVDSDGFQMPSATTTTTTTVRSASQSHSSQSLSRRGTNQTNSSSSAGASMSRKSTLDSSSSPLHRSPAPKRRKSIISSPIDNDGNGDGGGASSSPRLTATITATTTTTNNKKFKKIVLASSPLREDDPATTSSNSSAAGTAKSKTVIVESDSEDEAIVVAAMKGKNRRATKEAEQSYDEDDNNNWSPSVLSPTSVEDSTVEHLQERFPAHTPSVLRKALLETNGYIEDAVSWLFQREPTTSSTDAGNRSPVASWSSSSKSIAATAPPPTKKRMYYDTHIPGEETDDEESALHQLLALLPTFSKQSLKVALRRNNKDVEATANSLLADDADAVFPDSGIETASAVTNKTKSKSKSAPMVQMEIQRLNRPPRAEPVVDADDREKTPLKRKKLVQRKKKAVVVVSESESDSDGDAKTSKDSPVDAASIVSEDTFNYRQSVLDFFNQESHQHVMDATSCTKEQADKLLALRPFTGYSHLVETLNATKGLSLRILSQYEDITERYRSVDILIAKCTSIATDLSSSIQQWSNDAVASSQSTVDSSDSVANENGNGEKEDTGLHLVELTPSKNGTAMEDPELIREQPAIINAELTLKGYQLIGVSWLWLLYRKGLSGILADDMVGSL